MKRTFVAFTLFCAIGAAAMGQGFSLDVMSFNLRNGKAGAGGKSLGRHLQ